MNSVLKKIEEKIENKNVLFINSDDIFYMTRFKSSNLSILYINNKWYAATDPRYLEAASLAIKDMQVVNMADPTWLQQLKDENDFEIIYLNENDITVGKLNHLDKLFKTIDVEVKTFDYGYIRDAYLAEDIQLLKEASKVNDSLMTKVIEGTKAGMTEKDVEAMILKLIIDAPGEGPSFEPIVASGPNSSKPHHHPSDRVIEEGELITIDMGTMYEGFCSDMTRTFSIGEIKDEEASKIWDMVEEATIACTEMIKPGVNCADVHNKAVEVFAKYGYDKYFTHGLGHGLGVEIHDSPAFNHKATDDYLVEGQVMTVEPGLYIPGKYGCRLENAVLVTKDGYELLNNIPFVKVK